ncbi:MAG: tetratricopeptide repeat protein [Candidatus Comchoanobacterales bacterium]
MKSWFSVIAMIMHITAWSSYESLYEFHKATIHSGMDQTRLGELYLSKGDEDEAIYFLNQAIENQSCDANYFLGKIYHQKKDPSEAKIYYDSHIACSVGQDNADISKVPLARIYLEDVSVGKAVSVLEGSSNAESMYLLSEIWEEGNFLRGDSIVQKDLNLAAELYLKAMRLSGEYEWYFGSNPNEKYRHYEDPQHYAEAIVDPAYSIDNVQGVYKLANMWFWISDIDIEWHIERMIEMLAKKHYIKAKIYHTLFQLSYL